MWVASKLAGVETAMLNARPDITRERAQEEIKNIESKGIAVTE
jgi:hypothetical protein